MAPLSDAKVAVVKTERLKIINNYNLISPTLVKICDNNVILLEMSWIQIISIIVSVVGLFQE